MASLALTIVFGIMCHIIGNLRPIYGDNQISLILPGSSDSTEQAEIQELRIDEVHIGEVAGQDASTKPNPDDYDLIDVHKTKYIVKDQINNPIEKTSTVSSRKSRDNGKNKGHDDTSGKNKKKKSKLVQRIPAEDIPATNNTLKKMPNVTRRLANKKQSSSSPDIINHTLLSGFFLCLDIILAVALLFLFGILVFYRRAKFISLLTGDTPSNSEVYFDGKHDGPKDDLQDVIAHTVSGQAVNDIHLQSPSVSSSTNDTPLETAIRQTIKLKKSSSSIKLPLRIMSVGQMVTVQDVQKPSKELLYTKSENTVPKMPLLPKFVCKVESHRVVKNEAPTVSNAIRPLGLPEISNTELKREITELNQNCEKLMFHHK